MLRAAFTALFLVAVSSVATQACDPSDPTCGGFAPPTNSLTTSFDLHTPVNDNLVSTGLTTADCEIGTAGQEGLNPGNSPISQCDISDPACQP